MRWSALPRTTYRFRVRKVDGDLEDPAPGASVKVQVESSGDLGLLLIDVDGKVLKASHQGGRQAYGEYFDTGYHFELTLRDRRSQEILCNVFGSGRGDPKVGSWTADEDGD